MRNVKGNRQAVTNISSSSDSEQSDAMNEDIGSKEKQFLSAEEVVLKKHDDMIYEGLTFKSEEEAYNTYNEYGRKVGFSIRKSNAQKRADGSIRSRIFVCYKQGFKQNDPRTKHVRKQKNTRTGCLARMMIKPDDSGEWVVSEFSHKHNHPFLTPRKAHLLSSHRNIDDVKKEEIESLNKVGIPPSDGFDYMVQQAGGHANVGMTRIDYKNYLRDKRLEELGKGDAGALLEYFTRKKSQNANFFSAIMVDDENQLTNFFWADATSIIDYAHFGDVVVFDTTYRTNRYGRPFAPFTGVNHHKETVLFGGALLIDERYESFVWLFETWMKAMSGKKPVTILTDQCASMAKAISIVFPETRHRLCLWHIFQNAVKHLAHVYKQKGFTEAFRSCIYGCETEEIFLGRWKQMLQDFDLVDNEWLKNILKIREKWALVYGRNTFCADMTTTQRSESINAFVKRFVHRKHSLIEFVNRYERALDRLRQTELKSDCDSVKSTPTLFAPVPMLKQASDVYTHAMFYMFEHEYKQHLMCKLDERGANDGIYEYEVTRVSQKRRTVRFNPINLHALCTCKKFEFAGFICRHIIKVLYHWNIHHIPAMYILKRWTKNANHGLVVDLSGNPIQDDCNVDVSLRYNELCRKAVNLAVKGASDEDIYSLVKRLLDDAMGRIEVAIKAKKEASKNTDKSKNVGVADDNTLVTKTLTVARGSEKGRSTTRPKSCLEKGKNQRKEISYKQASTEADHDERIIDIEDHYVAPRCTQELISSTFETCSADTTDIMYSSNDHLSLQECEVHDFGDNRLTEFEASQLNDYSTSTTNFSQLLQGEDIADDMVQILNTREDIAVDMMQPTRKKLDFDHNVKKNYSKGKELPQEEMWQ